MVSKHEKHAVEEKFMRLKHEYDEIFSSLMVKLGWDNRSLNLRYSFSNFSWPYSPSTLKVDVQLNSLNLFNHLH
ncbi:MAG: hypothetical protein J7J19_07115 [Thaumarchaeota archaeon]|nr:hypothetical protein [Nitrososphaerota archaeon]